MSVIDPQTLYGDAKATVSDADRRLRVKRLEAAEREYKAKPNCIETAIAYADCLFDVGRLSEAEKLLEKLVAENPENYDLVFNLGYTYLKQGKIEQAVERFKHVIAIAPRSDAAKSAEYELWNLNPTEEPPWVKNE